MRSLRLFFVAVLACGGCESYSYYGSGPITLTPEVQAALDEYMKHPGIGGMFAVSSDGTKYSAVHCDRCASLQRGYYLPETVREALGECNQQRNNNDCKIYAIADRIVWH